MHNSTRWPIHWIEAEFTTRGRKRPTRSYFGVCGRTQQVIQAGAPMLVVLVVNDVYVDEARRHCEEGQRCLNTACDLNTTTPATLSKNLGFKRIPKWMQAKPLEPIVLDDTLREFIAKLCEAHPDRGVVSSLGGGQIVQEVQ